jgi:hypothetical protein
MTTIEIRPRSAAQERERFVVIARRVLPGMAAASRGFCTLRQTFVLTARPLAALLSEPMHRRDDVSISISTFILVARALKAVR